uniref:Protein Vpu n=1 Tax=Human immunodeficiency virus type 1 TaxID=11676 RepID=B5LQF7_HV1|nr:vpu protein [Human immunodeficiency virus 1]
MLSTLHICAIAGLIVALTLRIIIWTLVGIEYKKLLKQKKIDRLIERIRERAEDSGNESDEDTEELSALVKIRNYNLRFDNNL